MIQILREKAQSEEPQNLYLTCWSKACGVIKKDENRWREQIPIWRDIWCQHGVTWRKVAFDPHTECHAKNTQTLPKTHRSWPHPRAKNSTCPIQLDAKVQRNTWSLVNSCVICSFLVFCLCFHQLVVIFSYLLIGCRDYFSFYSTTRNRKCSIIDKGAVTYLIRKLISRVPHDRLYEAASMARSHSSSASPSARSWDGKIILYLKWLSTRMHASWLTFRAEM